MLITEDSPDDLLLLQRALHRAGVPNPQVVATTAMETVRYLESAIAFENPEAPFPVVLFLDLVMPIANGLVVLEWLRAHAHPQLAIVLHTGAEDEDLLRRARDLGATFYLPKGTRPEAVKEVLSRAQAEWEQKHLAQP